MYNLTTGVYSDTFPYHETLIARYSIPQLPDMAIIITEDPTDLMSREEKVDFDRKYNKINKNNNKYIICLVFSFIILLSVFLFNPIPLNSLAISLYYLSDIMFL